MNFGHSIFLRLEDNDVSIFLNLRQSSFCLLEDPELNRLNQSVKTVSKPNTASVKEEPRTRGKATEVTVGDDPPRSMMAQEPEIANCYLGCSKSSVAPPTDTPQFDGS
ncbi:hypothetical protein [Rhizobium anhuiense]|uniref:hypothetical protein n=1 Tax=Rhizobium anhuiense TaxID=1184720 RepID=UPI00117B8E0D|nr:hypothetical protein [Rhizobium anhuiense]